MNLAMSASLLLEVLSRIRNPTGTPETLTQIGDLRIGQSLLLTINITGLSPRTLTVTKFELDSADQRSDLTEATWNMNSSFIEAEGVFNCQVNAIADMGACPTLQINAHFQEATGASSWRFDTSTSGAFDILASLANSPAPILSNTGKGQLIIGA